MIRQFIIYSYDPVSVLKIKSKDQTKQFKQLHNITVSSITKYTMTLK